MYHRRKLAELSLVFGIPIFTGATESSRLSGLQQKLQPLAVKEMRSFTNIPISEDVIIDERLKTWLKDIGWWDNKIHVSLLVSLCLDIIEESPHKYSDKITDTLEKLGEHLMEGEEFEAPTPEERDALLKSWEKVYE